MAFENFIGRLVRERTVSEGAGALVLGGATIRRRQFSAAGITNGKKFIGLIEHTDDALDEYELGPMTISGSSVVRSTPWLSSNSGATVNFSAGEKHITLVDIPAPDVRPLRIARTDGEAVMTRSDYELGIDKNVAGATPVTLPPILFPGQRCRVSDFKGDGSANNITLSGDSGATINGVSTFVIDRDNQTVSLRAISLTEWLIETNSHQLPVSWDFPNGFTAEGNVTFSGGDVVFENGFSAPGAAINIGSLDVDDDVIADNITVRGAGVIAGEDIQAGNADTRGADIAFAASRGTGDQPSGDIIIRLAPAGSSGSSQNALVDFARWGVNPSYTPYGALYIGGTAFAVAQDNAFLSVLAGGNHKVLQVFNADNGISVNGLGFHPDAYGADITAPNGGITPRSAKYLEVNDGTKVSNGGNIGGMAIGDMHLEPIAEPATPDVGFVMFTDEADGILKVKDSLGTVKVVTLS